MAEKERVPDSKRAWESGLGNVITSTKGETELWMWVVQRVKRLPVVVDTCSVPESYVCISLLSTTGFAFCCFLKFI